MNNLGNWASFLGTGIGAIDSLATKGGTDFGAFASGAGMGASIGTAFGGPVGIGVGALLGGTASLLQRQDEKRRAAELKRQQEEAKRKAEFNVRKGRQYDLNNRFNVDGMNVPGFYAKGGNTPKNNNVSEKYPENFPHLIQRVQKGRINDIVSNLQNFSKNDSAFYTPVLQNLDNFAKSKPRLNPQEERFITEVTNNVSDFKPQTTERILKDPFFTEVRDKAAKVPFKDIEKLANTDFREIGNLNPASQIRRAFSLKPSNVSNAEFAKYMAKYAKSKLSSEEEDFSYMFNALFGELAHEPPAKKITQGTSKINKALGGNTPSSYLAEGGETIQHNPSDTPKTFNGNLQQLSSDISEIRGPSHESQSGGVLMQGGERIFSDQIKLSKEAIKYFKSRL